MKSWTAKLVAAVAASVAGACIIAISISFVVSELAASEQSPSDLTPTLSSTGTTASGSPSQLPKSSTSQLPNNPTTPATVGPTIGVAVLPDPGWVVTVADRTGIPIRALSAYAGAALAVKQDQQCTVGWNTIAAIALVESDHGRHGGSEVGRDGVARPPVIGVALNGNGVAKIADSDDGKWDGDPVWDRAVGPLQFLPDTWRRWGADGNGDQIADPQQIDDAALAAARYLCASGDLTTQSGWLSALWSYNRSESYREQVAAAAKRYGSAG